MPPDPFGQALRDHHRGEREQPLVQRDGAETLTHPIEAFYFRAFSPNDATGAWLAGQLDGPLLDIGAGVGRHALYFQDQFEVVAIEISAHLVDTMDERGVRDAREGDMFALRDGFERDRFQSALAEGTQLGLAGSMRGLRRFLSDLAYVTTPDATVVLDGYDPEAEDVADLLGYRSDPTPGLAFRVMTFAYRGAVSDILLFRLFSPGRLEEAAVGAGWEVQDVRRPSSGTVAYYRVALTKR